MPCSRADLRDVAAERREPAHDVRGVVADGRRDLDHRLHQLGVDPRLELVSGDGREHRLDVLDEVERLRVEQLVLLLDAQRVRVALAELVVEHAPRGERAVAGDRGGNGLFADHGMTASTSISTFHLGSKRRARTVVFAGRTPPKTSA